MAKPEKSLDYLPYFDDAKPILRLFFNCLMDEVNYVLIDVGRQDLAKGLVNGLVVVTNRILTNPRITDLRLEKTKFLRRNSSEDQTFFGLNGKYFTNASTYGELEKELQPLLSDDIEGLQKNLVNFRIYNGKINLGLLEDKIEFEETNEVLYPKVSLDYYVGSYIKFLSANLRIKKSEN